MALVVCLIDSIVRFLMNRDGLPGPPPEVAASARLYLGSAHFTSPIAGRVRAVLCYKVGKSGRCLLAVSPETSVTRLTQLETQNSPAGPRRSALADQLDAVRVQGHLAERHHAELAVAQVHVGLKLQAELAVARRPGEVRHRQRALNVDALA